MNNFLLGWAIAMTVTALFCIFLLFKKPTTENNIKSQKQKIKRNKGSNSSNDMDIRQEQENPKKTTKKPKERKLRRIFKRKNK